MRLKNILIVVKDIDKSVEFYRDLFGLDVLLYQEGNVMMTEGLVLQDGKVWEEHLGLRRTQKSNSCELYFEETAIEAFVEKMERCYPNIEYVNKLMSFEWGGQMVRFYDLDGHLIEVRSPL